MDQAQDILWPWGGQYQCRWIPRGELARVVVRAAVAGVVGAIGRRCFVLALLSFYFYALLLV